MARQARRSTQTRAKKTAAKPVGLAHTKANGAKPKGAKTIRTKTTRTKTANAKAAGTKTAHAKATTPQRWSKEVTEHSDALDLRKGVFKLKDPKKIAASLKSSAEHSSRRKTSPYRSALSMLIFYMNRAGKNLPVTSMRILQRTKRELRRQFGRG